MTVVPEEILFSVEHFCTYTRYFCNHLVFSVHPDELVFETICRCATHESSKTPLQCVGAH